MAQKRPLYRDASTGRLTEVGVPIDDSTPGHNGELLIWDSVQQAYIPGDPLVQGVYADGSAVPNPVYVGAKSTDGFLYGLASNNQKDLCVDLEQANLPAPLPVSFDPITFDPFSVLDVRNWGSDGSPAVKTQWIPVKNGGFNPPFSAQVTTAVQVALGQTQLYGWSIMNTTAAIAYVQVFDAMISNVTLGTTQPRFVIPIPANGTTGAGNNFKPPPTQFTYGIVIAATTTRTGSTTAACDVLMWTA